MYIDVLFLEVQVLLLTDVLVLMEKSEDKDKYKYHLRCHTLIDAIKEKEEVKKMFAFIYIICNKIIRIVNF